MDPARARDSAEGSGLASPGRPPRPAPPRTRVVVPRGVLGRCAGLAAVLAAAIAGEAAWRSVRVIPLALRGDEAELGLTPDLFGLDADRVVTEGERPPLVKTLRPGGVVRFEQRQAWVTPAGPYTVGMRVEDHLTDEDAGGAARAALVAGRVLDADADELAFITRPPPGTPPGPDVRAAWVEGGDGRRLRLVVRVGRRVTTFDLPEGDASVGAVPGLVDRIRGLPPTRRPEDPALIPWERWLPPKLREPF